jgi:hypothetical protein
MADYNASGAGTSAANQDYTENGTQESKPKYQGDADSTYWLAYGSVLGGWVISTDPGAATTISSTGPHAYYIYSAADTPPLTGWQVGGTGSAPAPTLSLTPRAMLPAMGVG